jgi:hypothetical protein
MPPRSQTVIFLPRSTPSGFIPEESGKGSRTEVWNRIHPNKELQAKIAEPSTGEGQFSMAAR